MKKPSSWNGRKIDIVIDPVVNCFQILYIRSLNTIIYLWRRKPLSCELLSDFVYSFFEHNEDVHAAETDYVVNCFQILYIRSLNTMSGGKRWYRVMLWIAFRFCIFVLWTQLTMLIFPILFSCELLSDFVYSFFEHNQEFRSVKIEMLWIAFRFCIFVLWTQ